MNWYQIVWINICFCWVIPFLNCAVNESMHGQQQVYSLRRLLNAFIFCNVSTSISSGSSTIYQTSLNIFWWLISVNWNVSEVALTSSNIKMPNSFSLSPMHSKHNNQNSAVYANKECMRLRNEGLFFWWTFV